MLNGLANWEKMHQLSALADALPETIDLLTLVMQAGLDFQVALKCVLDECPEGPLKRELGLVWKDIQLGVSRVDALRRLAERAPHPALQETVRTLVCGIELGSPLAPLLRAQAQALRRARVYQIERRAAQAPLKLLFPLIVFIFPTIFIVLFGPLALRMSEGGFP